MQYSLVFSFAILVLSSISYAGLPVPLILKPNEEFLHEGSVDDSVTCGEKIFNTHTFSINVVQDSKPCNCSEDPPKKVYLDGLLAGVCTKEVKFYKVDNYPDSFINFALLDNFSDEEIIKLFSTKVGSCQLYDKNLEITKRYNSKDIKEIFQAYKLEASIALKSKEDSPKVIAKSLREVVKSGLCGTYSKSTVEKNLENSNRILGKQDIGFEHFKSQGLNTQALLKMRYPAIRFKDSNISLKDFKAEEYSAYDLKKSLGVPAKDLKNVGYNLNDLAPAYDVKELRELYKLKELSSKFSVNSLKNGGFSAAELKDVGIPLNELAQVKYDSKELKQAFTAKEFYKHYNAPSMKQVGFTAAEQKAAGVPLTELMQAKYDGKELKQLFTAKEFYKHYNAPSMKQVGFTAAEQKDAGVPLTELVQAKYDNKELKEIFTAKEFYKHYNAPTMKQVGFTAAEQKDAGVPLTELMQARYDYKDLKEAFTAKEFYKHYNAPTMKQVGFSVLELKDAGVPLSEMAQANYNKDELKANFAISDFKQIYSDQSLKQLGFTDQEIADN